MIQSNHYFLPTQKLTRFYKMIAEVRRPWSTQQDEAVKIIVKRIGIKKWSAVSQSMETDYGLKGRTGKQCRQRWHNHLDPEINRKPWTVQEENIIFDAHRKYGNKWTQIAQLLSGRTDNSVKNHFYSTIRRSLRRISKALGEKNSTSQMRDVKPSVLSEIFHYAQLPQSQQNSQNRQLVWESKSLSESLLQFASLKSCTKGSPLIQNNRQRLQNLNYRLKQFKSISLTQLKQRRKHLKLEQFDQQLDSFSKIYSNKYEPSSSPQNQSLSIKNLQKKQIQTIQVSQTDNQSHSLHKFQIISPRKKQVYDWDMFYTNCQLVLRYNLQLEGLSESKINTQTEKLWQKIRNNA